MKMNRRDFVRLAGLGALGSTFAPAGMAALFKDNPTTKKMPVLFLGHGNPMNAITDNKFAKKWTSSMPTM